MYASICSQTIKTLSFSIIQCVLLIYFLKYDELLQQNVYFKFDQYSHDETYTQKTLPENNNVQLKGKLFAYHVLTEDCLPEYLLKSFVLGDPTDRDVYVLSYKNECSDLKKSPAHVRYILGIGTTWTQGRNLLFQFVRDAKLLYKYHIYLDDDAILFYSNTLDHFALEKGFNQDEYPEQFMTAFAESEDGLQNALYNWTNSPWRYYEDKLIKESPAFAQVNLGQKRGFQSRRLQLEKWKYLCASQQMPDITPTLFIDTIIIAYHNEALPLLMPFDATFDDHSWFISAMYQMYRMKALLFKQGIAIWSLTVLNLKHRPYPRDEPPSDYLQKYFDSDGRTIRGLLDQRDRDFVMFYDKGKWKDVFFGDVRLCTAPLKFPITEHYNLSMNDVF